MNILYIGVLLTCGWKWIPPTQRMNDTVLLPEEIAGYEVNIDGSESILHFPPTTTEFTWKAETCHPCGVVNVRTRDTDGLVSDWAKDTCPPVPPVLCQ